MSIIAKDMRWVVYTPTKCGTTSLEKLLVDNLGVADKHVPRHDMRVRYGEARRYMVTRHPLDRWCSMYWAIDRWTRNGSHPFMWEWAACMGAHIDDFVKEWAKRRAERPWATTFAKDATIYTNNNRENSLLCEPERVFDFDTGLGALACSLGLDFDEVRVPHVNKTAGRPGVLETLRQVSGPLLRGSISPWAEYEVDNWYGGDWKGVT